MKPIWFFGVDPGFEGGLGLIHGETLQAYAERMPVIEGKGAGKTELNLLGIREWLLDHVKDVKAIRMFVLERVQAMAKGKRPDGSKVSQGSTSMLRYGEAAGQIRGALAWAGVPYLRPMPQVWKKKVLAGTAKDKAAAIEYCQSMFPGLVLPVKPRKKEPFDGPPDALCLAQYGRLYVGSNPDASEETDEDE